VVENGADPESWCSTAEDAEDAEDTDGAEE
jgi:hypothetical protein